MSIYRLHASDVSGVKWAYWISYQESDGEKKRLLVWQNDTDPEVHFREQDDPLHKYAERTSWFHTYSHLEQLGLGKLIRLMHETLEEDET